MGGLGRTTLVRKVVNKIKNNFDCFAWITISKSDKNEELLWTMLKHVFESTGKQVPSSFHTINQLQLKDKLRAYLQHKSHISAQVHNLQPLPLDKAHELFYKKIFPSSGDCPAGLLAWSDMILERCEGLPLAIAALGTLLSHAERTTDAWKKLHDSLGAKLHMNGCLSSTRKVLSICYDDSPYYLSLFMFGMEALFATQNIRKSFCILKVLDLEVAPLDMFPQVMCERLLLRYLSLRDTKIQKLPKSLGRLQNLETLDLKQTLVTQLHDNILRLEKLRHLLVDHRLTENFPSEQIRGFKTSSKIGRLEALQKLSYIRAGKNGGRVIQALGNLTQLRKLGIVEQAEEDGKHLSHSIKKMVNLRSLDVKSIKGEFRDLVVVSSPPLLQSLYLNRRLQKLLDAYTGTKLDFLPGKFQKSEDNTNRKLEHARIGGGGNSSLSSLEKLVISQCRKIQDVPEGISELARLKELNLYNMSEKLVSGLEKNGGQFHGLVKHIPSHSFVFSS
ncbi:disease resistance protein RPM1-like [Diospyros lotus]|uniref:disease resistance protein RPM1-like n=1 Tax=Diospyros lotus TaxID=55363 RepID=UPI002251811C|nr:disease resistance protein RPM1-like [Diospyros lotus]